MRRTFAQGPADRRSQHESRRWVLFEVTISHDLRRNIPCLQHLGADSGTTLSITVKLNRRLLGCRLCALFGLRLRLIVFVRCSLSTATQERSEERREGKSVD